MLTNVSVATSSKYLYDRNSPIIIIVKTPTEVYRLTQTKINIFMYTYVACR